MEQKRGFTVHSSVNTPIDKSMGEKGKVFLKQGANSTVDRMTWREKHGFATSVVISDLGTSHQQVLCTVLFLLVTNYHKFIGLKQHKIYYIIVREVRFQSWQG